MVYLFLADGFEEIEALCCVDILRRAQIEIKTVGVGKTEIRGAHSIVVKSDISENEIKPDEITAVILPGGLGGTKNMNESETVKNTVKYAAEGGAYVCAICAAPSILGEMGLLRGKSATCYPGFEKSFEGADYTAAAVERDGRIITSKAMGTAYDFALEIVAALKGADKAQKVKEEIYYAG